jgi:hypothetical protein
MFEFFDVFSQVQELRIKGKKRIPSVFSSIVGFLSICATVIGVVYYSYEYFAKLTYSTNFYIDNFGQPSIDLRKFKLAILLTDMEGNEFSERHRLFQVSAKYWNIFIPGPMDTRNRSLEYSTIPKIKCTDYKENSLFKNDTDNLGMKYDTDCFEFENLPGIYGSKRNFGEFTAFDVYFQKCLNTTYVKNCFPEEYIDEKLKNFHLTISYIDNEIKLDDPNNPFVPFINHNSFPMSSTIYKILTTQIGDLRLNTDTNLFFKQDSETKSYKFQATYETTDFRNELSIFPGTFSHLAFETTGNIHRYTRNYKKLFNVITDIGGFYNGVKFIATLVLYIYSSNKNLWHFISVILSSEQIDESINRSPSIRRECILKEECKKEENKRNSLQSNKIYINPSNPANSHLKLDLSYQNQKIPKTCQNRNSKELLNLNEIENINNNNNNFNNENENENFNQSKGNFLNDNNNNDLIRQNNSLENKNNE